MTWTTLFLRNETEGLDTDALTGSGTKEGRRLYHSLRRDWKEPEASVLDPG
jgi:hypothetical protein